MPPLIPLALAAALVAGAPALAADPLRQAQDMRYGESLYHYYQGNNFDALSALMVAEARGQIRQHRGSAQLMEGGFSLAFGLERRAAELFDAQLQDKSAHKPASLGDYRTRALLKLAELNYRHENWLQSRAHLENAGAAAQPELAFNLALRSGELPRAAQLLEGAHWPLEQRALAHINLGAALARGGELPQAADQYHRAAALLGNPREEQTALWILRDKAHTGAGYAYALQQQHARAAEEFRRVRLRTPWADRALLGLGWSAINGGDHRGAVDALQFLIAQNPLSPEVQEALLALPYSYEKSQRPRAALLAYQQAERQYGTALSELGALQREIQSPQFTAVSTHSDWRYGWLEAAEAPPLVRENQRYLRRLLQSDRFQLHLSELRDLQQMLVVADSWQARLPLFQQLVDERALRHAGVVSEYRDTEFAQQLTFAEQLYRELQQHLEHVQREQDWFALLDGEAGAQLAKLEDAQSRYALLAAADSARPHQEQTLNRARGLLLWQAAESYHDNLWHKRKALQQLAGDLESARERRQRVDETSGRDPALNRLQVQVDAARGRLQAQRRAIAEAARDIDEQIRRDLLVELAREAHRVEQFQAHTRLAIARLHDAMREVGP